MSDEPSFFVSVSLSLYPLVLAPSSKQHSSIQHHLTAHHGEVAHIVSGHTTPQHYVLYTRKHVRHLCFQICEMRDVTDEYCIMFREDLCVWQLR